MAVPRLQHVASGDYLDIGLNAGGEGGALFGAGDGDSSARVSIADPVKAVEKFSIAGVNGVAEAHHGTRERTIRWSGALRLSNAGRTTVLDQRDAMAGYTGRWIFQDETDRTFENVRLVSFEIGEFIAIVPDGDLVWRAEYVITLEQMEV